MYIRKYTEQRTDLQGQEDGFPVCDKDGEGLGTEVLGEGSEWFQSLNTDLESEPKNHVQELDNVQQASRYSTMIIVKTSFEVFLSILKYF